MTNSISPAYPTPAEYTFADESKVTGNVYPISISVAGVVVNSLNTLVPNLASDYKYDDDPDGTVVKSIDGLLGFGIDSEPPHSQSIFLLRDYANMAADGL